MAKQIKALISDVDGVWTNGDIWISEQGLWRRNFFIHDGYGVKALLKAGFKVAVISGSRGEDIKARCQHLGVEEIHLGVEYKYEIFQDILKRWSLQADEVAYVGDDVMDLEILQSVGLAFTVPNAHKEILKHDFICTEKSGGKGALREICDKLLELR